MYLAVVRSVTEAYVARVDRSSYNTLHENDLPNEPFCGLEIVASDGGD